MLSELRSVSLGFEAAVKQLKAGDWNIDETKFTGEPTEVWNDVVLYVGEAAAGKMQQLFELRDPLVEAIVRAVAAIRECADGTPSPVRNPYNPPLNERNAALENLDRVYEAFGQATNDLLQALRDDMTACGPDQSSGANGGCGHALTPCAYWGCRTSAHRPGPLLLRRGQERGDDSKRSHRAQRDDLNPAERTTMNPAMRRLLGGVLECLGKVVPARDVAWTSR